MIQTITAVDIPQFSHIATRCYEQAYDGLIVPSDIDSFVQASFAPIVVQAAIDEQAEIKLLWDKDQIAGYIWLEPRGTTLKQPQDLDIPRPLYLKRLYLLSTYTGNGYGLELLQQAVSWGKQQGFSHLWLTVWDQNPRAQKFYAREGFIIVGDCDFWCGELLCRDWVMIRTL